MPSPFRPRPFGIACTVVLVAGALLARPAEAEETPSHVVAPGETLWRIARQAGVEVATLRRLNGLRDEHVLLAGRRLVVPTSRPVSQARHTVAPGETVWRLARQYGTTVAALLEANGLERPEQLRAGAELRLPPPAQGQPAAAAGEARATGSAGQAPATAPTPARQAQPPAPAPQPPPKPAARPAAAAPTASLGPTLARLAEEQVGRPYAWGGTDPTGFDCSGLVWYVASQAGRPVPRDLAGQYASGPHPAPAELQPGDLVFSRDTYKPGLSHDGIYVGSDRFVSAIDERHGVGVASLSAPYWLAHFFGVTRLS